MSKEDYTENNDFENYYAVYYKIVKNQRFREDDDDLVRLKIVFDTCFDIKTTIEKLEYEWYNLTIDSPTLVLLKDIKHRIEKLKELFKEALEKKSNKKNSVLETCIKTWDDIKNRLEKLEIIWYRDELDQFCKDVTHEIEKSKNLYIADFEESEKSEKTKNQKKQKKQKKNGLTIEKIYMYQILVLILKIQ